MKKMVYFHPTLNNPPLGGGQVHSHEMLKTLKELGFELYLFVLETKELPILIRKNWGYKELCIYMDQGDKKKLQRAFSDYIDQVKPEFIFINYVSWDFVLDHSKYAHLKRILYNHHFESLRKKMRDAYCNCWNALEPKTIEEVSDELTDLDFFKKRFFEPDPEEFEIYNRYDITFCIADCGEKQIREKCNKTQVVSFPVTLTPKVCDPRYEKKALLASFFNPFNVQGYLFFVKKVLPLILKVDPFFQVRLLGYATNHFFSSPNIICKEFTLDLEREYQRAALSLCPTFSGTGQQIKIIESMHYALPVVCMENTWQYNPVLHGETGFIAKTAEEFALYTLKLYQNPELCKEMGRNGQEVAKAHYSNALLKDRFKEVLI